MSRFRTADGGVEFVVRVQPGASRDEILPAGGHLKVRVAAPPEHGKANARLLEVLSGALGLKRSQLQVVKGSSSRVKTIRVFGADASDIETDLGRLFEGVPES
ncbi:MAG: DUF167 domain-containing protein [Firmicutes bacterium]|nr:DUF167 domain-containing protein [Bacillota bacterium]